MKILEVSPSSLNLYKQCPYAYYLKHIEKIPPKHKYQEIIDVGLIAHKIIQTYYEIYPSLSDMESILNKAKQTVSKLYAMNDLMRSIIDNSITNFISFEKRRRKKLDVRPLTEFEVRVKNGKVMEKGILDIFIKKPCIVADFKVSRLQDIRDDYKLQLNFYRRIINRKFGFKPKTYLFYLLSNELVEVKDENDYNEKINQLIAKLLASLEENYFPPSNSNCNECPFAYKCKHTNEVIR